MIPSGGIVIVGQGCLLVSPETGTDNKKSFLFKDLGQNDMNSERKPGSTVVVGAGCRFAVIIGKCLKSVFRSEYVPNRIGRVDEVRD
jgi:hypothetical protein